MHNFKIELEKNRYSYGKQSRTLSIWVHSTKEIPGDIREQLQRIADRLFSDEETEEAPKKEQNNLINQTEIVRQVNGLKQLLQEAREDSEAFPASRGRGYLADIRGEVDHLLRELSK